MANIGESIVPGDTVPVDDATNTLIFCGVATVIGSIVATWLLWHPPSPHGYRKK